MHTIDFIDSHTGGEPTRVVLAGFPDLGNGSLAERRNLFRSRYDRWRQAIACEPRGSDTMVGALLLQPTDPSACAGVIYFNNVGYLGMCGHGTIGLVRTLHHLGRIAPGRHKLETPVGMVGIELHADGRVSIDNVESYRHAKDVELDVPGYGTVTGDIAWGGNWFFISNDSPLPLTLANQRALTIYTEAIRLALEAANIRGADGEIDHIELNGAPAGRCRRAQFRAVSRPGLRPLALRHRHQRQGGLPGGRRQAGARPGVAPGRHSRQRVRSAIPAGRTRCAAAHHRQRAHHAQGQLLIDDANDPLAWGIGTA